MLPPSSLPSGFELKRLVMRGICDEPALTKYWARMRGLVRFRAIVPEIVFQRVYECLDERFDPVFDVIKLATPNSAHQAIAALGRRFGASILTTNFDLLLEDAGATDVTHLHGGVHNKAQMVYRINRVALGLHQDVAKTVSRAVKDRVLCVLGYSGLDKDVIDAVNAARPARVWWLARNRSDIGAQNAKKLRCTRVTLATGELSDVVASIVARFSLTNSPYGALNRQDRDARRRIVTGWKAKLSRAERYAAASAVLFELGEYRAAADVALAGGKLRRQSRVSRSWFQRQASNALKIHGEFDEALGAAERAAKQHNATPYELAAAWNSIGLVHLEKDDFDVVLATQAFQRSIQQLRHAKTSRLPVHKREQVALQTGRVFNNLGLALTYSAKTKAALNAFMTSLRVKRDIGDLIGVAHTSSNVSILHYRAGDYRSARRWRLRAMALLTRYDLQFERAYLLRQTGALSCQRGRRRNGLRLLEEALALYRSIPSAKFGAKLTRRIIRQYRGS